jgi:hypothetical protein
VEDTPLKGLYALAFVFSSFAACAQTPGPPTMLLFDFDDYFGEITEMSPLPPPIIATEPMGGKSGEAAHETNDIAAGGPNNATDAPVGTIQPSEEHASVQLPIWWDDKLAFEDTTEPDTVPARIVLPEQTIEKFGEASDKADDIAIARSSDAADVRDGLVRHSDETATVEHSTVSDNTPKLEETPDVPVGAVEPSHARATTAWSPGEYNLTVGEATGQSEGLPQAF